MIDNALVEPGRQLEVTEQLGDETARGFEGTVELEWRFADRRRGQAGRMRSLDPVRGLGLT